MKFAMLFHSVDKGPRPINERSIIIAMSELGLACFSPRISGSHDAYLDVSLTIDRRPSSLVHSLDCTMIEPLCFVFNDRSKY